MEDLTLNPLELWSQAIGWTLIGVLFVKLLILDKKHILENTFNWKYWLADNGLDALRGITLTLITVKLGEVIFQLLGMFGLDFGNVVQTIKTAGLDPIQISLVVAIAFQWWLFKRKNAQKEKIE